MPETPQATSSPSARQQLSHSAAPRINRPGGLDLELQRLRRHLRRTREAPPNSPALLSVASMLHSITLSLLSLTDLLRAHQALVSGGEPLAQHLEQALIEIARDLEESGAASPGQRDAH